MLFEEDFGYFLVILGEDLGGDLGMLWGDLGGRLGRSTSQDQDTIWGGAQSGPDGQDRLLCHLLLPKTSN